MKRAILMRHASAADARDDALRELTPRGGAEAVRAGAKIAALGALWAPTLALCSTALRATATLAGARPALLSLARCELDARLYLASAGDLLAALQRTPERDACLLVVAHEPGLSALVRQLAQRGEPSARARFARGMPPASFAALALELERWENAGSGCGELVEFARASAP